MSESVRKKPLQTIPLDDSGTFEDIISTILSGQFTPFLGAGASSLRSSEVPVSEFPWCALWSNLQKINVGLQSDVYQAYLLSFASQRLATDSDRTKNTEKARKLLRNGVSSRRWNLGGLRAGARSWPSAKLLKLQRSLVGLAAELGKVFGLGLGREFMAFERFSDLEIPIGDLETDECSGIVDKLILAIDAAADLPENQFPSCVCRPGRSLPPQLRSEAVYERLLILACEVLNNKTWSGRLRLWRRRHEAKLDEFPGDIRKRPTDDARIRAEVVEWISELLWYTVRFWIPCFPTTGEMAFEISLRTYLTPLRRAGLAQAAEATILPEDLARDLHDWFKYIHDYSNGHQEFHLSIAAALQHTYDIYKDAESERHRTSSSGFLQGQQEPGARVESEAPLPQKPVAFTTNFDKMLENVFARLEIDHHVVYPMRYRHGRGAAKIKWRFCTHSFSGKGANVFAGIRWCNEIFDDLNDPRVLVGPVIVKLHGSPLDKEDDDNEHWLVLSEREYLEALDRTFTAFPGWLERELGGREGTTRGFWFLGYSVSDWNVRLRLYEHLRYSRGAEYEPTKKAVNRRRDLFQMAILSSLGVCLCEGDLRVFPKIIRVALGKIQHTKRSLGLQRIMEELYNLGAV